MKRWTIGILLVTIGCKHDPAEPQPDPLNTTSVATSTTATSSEIPPKPGNDSVCFNTQVLPLFVANCAMSGCHDAIAHKDGYNFTTYHGIRSGVVPFQQDAGKVMKALKETDQDKMMPPAGQLPSSQIALIQKWITQGALERNCENACDTILVKYTSHIAPLIQTYCQGCHNSQAPLLMSYTDVRTATQAPGKLICAINHAGCLNMPQGGAKLNSCDIRKFEKWLAGGCPQ